MFNVDQKPPKLTLTINHMETMTVKASIVGDNGLWPYYLQHV